MYAVYVLRNNGYSAEIGKYGQQKAVAEAKKCPGLVRIMRVTEHGLEFVSEYVSGKRRP